MLIITAQNEAGKLKDWKPGDPLPEISNYDVKVYIGGGYFYYPDERTRTIGECRVEGHNRSDGWLQLLYLILKEFLKE